MPSKKNASLEVIKIAKRIRKHSPNMKWQTAMKKAGVEYRRIKKK